MNDESKTEYFPCSPKSEVYLTHAALLAPLEQMEVGKCIALPKKGVLDDLLAEIVASMSKGKKRFATIEHEDLFEVFRLPDGFPAELVRKFSKSITQLDKIGQEDSVLKELVKVAACKFHLLPLTTLLTYCVGIPTSVIHEKLIPYAYLQRRVSCLAAFRKYPKGPNEGLKIAISILEKEGVLKEVPKPYIQEKHNCNSKCYTLEKN